jgi:hypothetical protein
MYLFRYWVMVWWNAGQSDMLFVVGFETIQTVYLKTEEEDWGIYEVFDDRLIVGTKLNLHEVVTLFLLLLCIFETFHNVF